MHRIGRKATISIIIPVYNEVRVLEPLLEELRGSLKNMTDIDRYEIIMVNDGSKDGSDRELDRIAARCTEDVTVIHLARNFGHSAAVCAGMDRARSDASIVMDADMQDDPAAFGAFLEKWREGYDVVYAVRSSRKESGSIRLLFWFYYRILNRMAEIELPLDSGNFALMDGRVVEKLVSMPERNRYLPGLRAWVGFRQIGVFVPRRKRYDGRPRVGMRGLWRLAMNAVFSFSYVPLIFLRLAGVIAVAISLGLASFALYHKIFTGLAMKAWASQIIAVAFFGGVNLFGLGVIGEYVARIYDEVKGRPIYVIDRITPAGRENEE
ncbi:MAG: glycosyltransferase family 2 protein [Pseudomonadota bacterium]